jgi:hypothetical protein
MKDAGMHSVPRHHPSGFGAQPVTAASSNDSSSGSSPVPPVVLADSPMIVQVSIASRYRPGSNHASRRGATMLR